MTRRTALILYSFCGLTGGLLAVIRNQDESDATHARAKEAQAGAGKTRPGSSGPAKQDHKPASYRFSDEWSELMEEGRVLTAKDEPPPSYWLYDDAGGINDEGIAAAGLADDQAREVKAAMEDAREAMFRLFAEGVELDKRKPKDKVDEIWYRIPNQLEPGAKVFKDLQKRFETICGEKKAGELMKALNPFFRYANFGRQDVSLRWSREKVDGQEQWKGEVHCYDAPTGQEVTGTILRSREALRACFGDGVPWPGD